MEIVFDRAFYSASAVKRAIRDYKNLADFSCLEKKGKLKVKITNIRHEELKPLFREEFSNCVLAWTGALK